MSFEDKVIIEVALNENQIKDDNPNIPYGPEEIAADAKRCYDAGAAAVHWHGRAPGSGELRLEDPEINIAGWKLINQAAPLITYFTYGNRIPVLDNSYIIGAPAHKRYRHFQAALEQGLGLEVGPIDLGSAIDLNAYRVRAGFPGGGKEQVAGWTMTRGHQINSGEDHLWLCRFCTQYGLKKTFAAFDT